MYRHFAHKQINGKLPAHTFPIQNIILILCKEAHKNNGKLYDEQKLK